MKKNFKRWLALTLAVVMVVTTCMTHTEGFLKATDGGQTEAAEMVDVPAIDDTTGGEDAVTPETQGETNLQEDGSAQEVQEIVIPKQEETPEADPEEKETTTLYKEETKPEKSSDSELQSESKKAPEENQEERIFPEYITAAELANGNYRAPHVPDGSGFLSMKKEGDGWACLVKPNWGDGPRNQHYVALKYDATGDEISYVRCDVYGGEKPGEVYYEATFVNTETKAIDKRSVLKGDTPKDLPNWGTGYWTLNETDGEDKQVHPEQIAVNGPVTYYWHKSVPTIDPAALSNVYIYVQITGDVPEGLVLNAHGWYTVGKSKLDIPVEPSTKEHGYDLIKNGEMTTEKAKSALISPHFEDYNPKDGLLAEEIYEKATLVELKAVSSGATDYWEEASGWCWHMDIQVEYEDIKDRLVEVIYKDGANQTVFQDQHASAIEGTATPAFDTNPNEEGIQAGVPSRPGYEFLGWEPEVPQTVPVIEGPDRTLVYTAKWRMVDISATGIEKVYDGVPASIQLSGIYPDTDTVEFYEMVDGKEQAIAENSFTNVTDRKVYVRVTRNGEVYQLKEPVSVKIKRRQVTIEAADSNKIYGEADPTFAPATLTGQVDGELTDLDLTVIRTDADNDEVRLHKNVLTIQKSKEDLEKQYTNYTFKIQPGDFDISTNDGGLTVTAENVSTPYDGEGHGVVATTKLAGATIRYMDEDGKYTLSQSPERINAGETTVKFRASLYGYKDAYGSATVTITKRPVVITAERDSKTYGEKDPKFKPATLTGQVEGELTDLDLTVIRTDAGNDEVRLHENVLTIQKSKEELEGQYTNYTFEVQPGNFDILLNEKDLTVAAEDVTAIYDGTEHGVNPKASVGGATITYKDENGNYTLSESPTGKDFGSKKVEFKASLYGYKDAYGSATVTITKRPATITVEDNSKTYGEADPKFNPAILTGQVAGELKDLDLTVIRTDADNDEVRLHENVLTIQKSKEELEGQYTNYTFEIQPGSFDISQNKKDLTVTAKDVTATYDGTGHGVEPKASVKKAVITYMDENGKYTLSKSPERTVFGETTVKFKASLYGYADAYGSAKIKVEKRPATITVADDNKTYGEADPKFKSATLKGQVEGELTDLDLTVVRTNAADHTVKVHKNVLTIQNTKEELERQYTNYTFEIQPGNFEILLNEKDLTVAAEDVTATYDGTNHGVNPKASVEGATITYKDEAGNYTLSTSPTKKNFGSKKVEFKASLYGYKDAYGSATVNVEKRPATITVADANKTYGESDPTFEPATLTGQVEGELTDLDLAVIRTDADNDEVRLHKEVLTIQKSKKDLEKQYTNYTFKIQPGNFDILLNETDLTVTAENVTATYDGTRHGVEPVASVEGATITYKDENGNYTLSESPTRKNFGSKKVEFKASLYGYKDAYGSATVTITKRPATITVSDANKTYGEKDPEFKKATLKNHVAGELGGLDLTVIRTDADNDEVRLHENVLTIQKSKEDLEKQYTNYTFEIQPGDFNISINETGLTVAAENVTAIYDGTGHGVNPKASVEGATITYMDADGNYTLTESPERINAGESTVEFKASLYGYADAYGSAKVNVEKRPATITVADNNKIYGEADPTFVPATLTGQVDGELTDLDLTVVRTNATDDTVKVHENVLTVQNTKEELEGWYPNYTFEIQPGNFEILLNEKDLTVAAKNVTATYDGSGHGVVAVASVEGATITYKDENGNYTLTESPERIDAGKTTVKFKASLYGYKDATGEANVNITKRPITIKANDGFKVYDQEALVAEGTSIVAGSLVEGHSYVANVTGSQLYVGTSESVIDPESVVITKNDGVARGTENRDVTANYAITLQNGTLTVSEGTPEQPVDPNKVITKTHEDKEYKLGEIITFTIKATNIYATPKTMTIVEQEGVTITGKSVFENVKPGETVETTATYVVSENDILNQSFTNNVSVKFGDGDSEIGNKDVVTEGEIENKNGHLTLQKEVTSKPANGAAYVFGETITYSIKAINDGNLTLTNVVVTDEMTGDVWIIESIVPGDVVTFETSHVVTEDDLINANGEIVNKVTAEGVSPDPEKPAPEVKDDEEKAPIDVAKPNLYVNKKVVDEKATYGLGEQLTYEVEVVNNGNVTIKNISVTDELTGDVWKIKEMKPGDAKTFTTKKYKVTEADILAGKVVNTAEAEGKAADHTDVKGSATVEILTDAKTDHLTVEKKSISNPGKDQTYELGDTITYEITVTNDGNLTIKDVVVTDTLGSSNGHVTWADKVTVDKDNNALIKEMKPGDVQKLTCTYVVTEADIIAGNVINNVTAGGASTDPEDPDPEVKPGQEVDKTEKEDPTYSVVKELVKEEVGKKFKVGETAHFNITVKNTGNVTLENIKVTEELDGATFVEGKGYSLNKDKTVATIDKLAVDGTMVLKAEYVVQQKDVDNGEAVNTLDVDAESTGKEEPDPVDPPKEEIPTEKHDPKFEATKVLTNKGTGENGKFKLGETATFDITVKNTGNVTLTNIKVTENLKGAKIVSGEGYKVVDGVAVIDEIKVGKSVVVKAEYVITQKDVDNGGARNSVTVTGNGPVDPEGEPDPENPDPKPVDPGTEIPTEEPYYNLTINYVYEDGRTAAPSVHARYLEGQTFGYTSPTIAGYTPDYAFVRSDANGMPARDVVFTVVYTMNPVVPVPEGDNQGGGNPTGGNQAGGNPTGGTPAGTTPRENAPVGAELQADGEEMKVIPVVEEKVPLAKRDLDDHECCILHFLLMLAAMIIYAAYTRSMKKRQERIAELRDELATEMLKRGLAEAGQSTEE